MLIDARHPYAPPFPDVLSEGAHIRLMRAPWAPAPEDHWREAPSALAMIERLGEAQRVFVTLGRSYAAAFRARPCRRYFFRVRGGASGSDGPITYVAGDGPYSVESEIALFRRLGVDALATRNDGARGARPKLLAARELRLPVYLLSRPAPAALALTTSSPRRAARWAVDALRRRS